MTRQRLTATNDAQEVEKLLNVYWSKDPDPFQWDAARMQLIEMHVSPDEFRPPVRERTAAMMSFVRPAFDLPAECDKETGRFGPMKMGNALVDEKGIKQVGTATFAPSAWKPPANSTYVIVTALALSPVSLSKTKRPVLKGMATYEVTDDKGEVTEKKVSVVGALSASVELGMEINNARFAFEGTPKGIQRMVEVATRQLSKAATRIATQAVKRDQTVIGFLQAHAKRGKSKEASILLAAIKASLPRIAARVSIYGMSERAASIGMMACSDLRLAAGSIASDMNLRNDDARIAAYLQEQSKTAKCMYAGMILACYPEPKVKTATTQAPTTVAGWLAWKD